MVTLSPDQAGFWARFKQETGLTGSPRGVDAFGDDPELCEQLLHLVLEGIKRATAPLVRDFQNDPDGIPRPGDLWIITDGAGQPACVIRTSSVEVRPFHSVDADFAFDEGEGDRSLGFWRAAHDAYFRRQAAIEGFEFSEGIEVACERFELVWAPGQPE